MSSEVERFDFFAFLDGGVALLDCHQSSDGSYVRYDDYEREVRCGIAAAIRMQDKCAALEAECERLRGQIDAILANPTQLVEAVEVVGWLHRQGNYTEAAVRPLTDDEEGRGWEQDELMTVAQHQRIMAGVRQQLAERASALYELTA